MAWGDIMAKITQKSTLVKKLEESRSQKSNQKVKKIVLISTGLVIFLTLGSYLAGYVCIFNLKRDNSFTRTIAKVFPYSVVEVNRGGVSYTDYYTRMDIQKHYYEKQGKSVPENLKTSVLTQLTSEELAKQEAKKLKVEVTSKETTDLYTKKAEANGGEEKFAQTIKDLYGISTSDYKNIFLYQEVLEEKLSNKLKESGNYLATEDEANKKLAEKTLEEIKAGASFEEKAIALSQDKVSATKGGDLGTLEKASVVKEVEDAAFSLLPGALYDGVVKSVYGYHLIKLVEKTDTTFHAKHILFKAPTYEGWLETIKKSATITTKI